MIRVIALLLLAALPARAGEAAPAQFRGYTEVNRLVHERIAKLNGFELGKYLLEPVSEPSTSGLLSLLGTYLGSDTDAQFRNGDPNSINMILWYILMNGLATDVSAFCHPSPQPAGQQQYAPLDLTPQLAAALAPLCAWPSDSAKTESVLLDYWTAVMSFDAPPEEYDAWKSYFLSDPEFSGAPAERAVAAMTLAILYNPYFLLRN